MVRANETFTSEQMIMAIELVLWVMAVLYSPAIRDAVFNLCEFDRSLRPIPLIEEWISLVRKKLDPIKWVDHEFTIEGNNAVRRSVMDTLTQPKNCVLCHEAMMQVLHDHEATFLGGNIEIGINYYSSVCGGFHTRKNENTFEDASQFVDQGIFNINEWSNLKLVRSTWVRNG